MKADDPRLCEVEPQFRERVVRRIAAVEEYLRTPTRKKAIEVGERVGLKSQQIYYLAMAWKARNDPRDLVGRGRRLASHSDTSQRQLDVVRDVLEGRATDCRHGNLADAIRQHARSLRITMPTDTTIYDMVRKVGRKPAGGDMAADFSVDVVVLDLPVEHLDGPVRPHMVTVTEIHSMTLAGAAFSIAPPTAKDFARALTDAVANAAARGGVSHPSGPLSIQLPETPLIDLDPIAAPLDRSGVKVVRRVLNDRTPGVRNLAGIAADAMGPIYLKRRVRTMLAFTSLEKRKASPAMGVAVPVHEAEAFVRHAIRAAANDNALARLNGLSTKARQTLERQAR